MGSRGAVEVPRGRLGRAVGGAGRRRGRDAGVRESALRARRARAAARGRSTPSEVVARLVAPTTPDATSGSSASSTARDARRRGPAPAAWTGPATAPAPGYAAQGNILVGAATVDALAETFEATARRSARAAAARVPRRRAGGGRRPSRTAVRVAARRAARRRLRAALRLRRRPARRRPRAADRRAASGSTRCTTGCSARRRARSGSPSTTRSRPRCASDSRALGYDGELAAALDRWAGVENLEERVDGADAIDPVVLDALREASP